MNDQPEKQAEKAEKSAESLNDTLGAEDYQKAMQAHREAAGKAEASLPNLEIFSSTDVEPVVKQNFNSWDTNKDGGLSKDELNAVLQKGETSDEEKTAAGLQRAFESIDQDEDGKLSGNELNELYESAKVYERTRERVDAATKVVGENFSEIDTDHDKLITRSEMVKAGSNHDLKLSAEKRQILREFGNRDSFDLVSSSFDRKTQKRTALDEPGSTRAISENDVKSLGRRLAGKDVEGHSMSAPGRIHDMYNPVK